MKGGVIFGEGEFLEDTLDIDLGFFSKLSFSGFNKSDFENHGFVGTNLFSVTISIVFSFSNIDSLSGIVLIPAEPF